MISFKDLANPLLSIRWRILIVSLASLASANVTPSAQSPATPPDVGQLVFLQDINIPAGTAFERVGRHESTSTGTAAPNLSPREVVARKALGLFGGISGIAFDAETNQLLALSDSIKPTLFVLDVKVRGQRLEIQPIEIIRLTELNGHPFSPIDPEGIALLRDGSLIVATECFVAGSRTLDLEPQNPALFHFNRMGQLLTTLALPKKFLGLSTEPTGVWPGKGIESLTISPDETRMYLATEGSLKQDGPRPDPKTGSQIRLVEYETVATHPRPAREFRYDLEPPPLPKGFKGHDGSRGLSELLALGDRQLLALERSFIRESDVPTESQQTEQRIELFHVDLEGATEVQSIPKLATAPEVRPARKTLLLDARELIPKLSLNHRSLDNFEGLCFGPTLEDGSQTILLISDDNFNIGKQRTALFVFRWIASRRG